MEISKDKEYQLKDGTPVRIYSTDAGGEHPVHGAYKRSDGKWMMAAWPKSGKMLFPTNSILDLVEVKPKHKVKIYVWKRTLADGLACIHFSTDDLRPKDGLLVQPISSNGDYELLEIIEREYEM